MADKTYKMQVTLTDNRVLDAGTFVAPQGPQGPQGPKGDPGSGGGNISVFAPLTEADNIFITLPSADTQYFKRSKTGAVTEAQNQTSLTIDFESEYFIALFNSQNQHLYIGTEESPQDIDYIVKSNNTLIHIPYNFGYYATSFVTIYEA